MTHSSSEATANANSGEQLLAEKGELERGFVSKTEGRRGSYRDPFYRGGEGREMEIGLQMPTVGATFIRFLWGVKLIKRGMKGLN